MNPDYNNELLLEKLVYSSHNNSCGIFYVIRFLSTKLWNKINKTARFPDVTTLKDSPTYLSEVWPQISHTLRYPDEKENIDYKDEEIKNIQCHKRVQGNRTHPNMTEECDKIFKDLCKPPTFIRYHAYKETCPNMTTTTRA